MNYTVTSKALVGCALAVGTSLAIAQQTSVPAYPDMLIKLIVSTTSAGSVEIGARIRPVEMSVICGTGH